MNDPPPASEALQFLPEWCLTTLASIGDAVITTDTGGLITFLNSVAESLTGWRLHQATGQPLDSVFRLINEESRQAVESPIIRALRDGVVVSLGNHSLLIAKDGMERAIDGKAAPIRNDKGIIAGCMLVFHEISERSRLEQAMQDALAYADNIIATLREPFLVLDSQLRVVTGNRSFYEKFHVRAEETQGCFVYDLGNRQWDIPKLRTLLEEVLPQNHAFHDFEVDHDFQTIGRKIMLLNARRIRKPGNQSELILLAIEDITERRQAEDERRERDARFTSLVKNIKDHAIFTLDLEGNITSWNVEAERILGYTETEALDQHFSMIFTPEDRQQGQPDNELRTARQQGRAEDERWHVRKGGELFWALGIITPTHDASGRHTGFSKILRDITERKQSEAKVADSELRYRRLFEASRDGILILDAGTGKITDTNPFMSELLGYTHSELLGKELWQIGLFQDKAASQAAFRRLQEEGYIRYEHLPLQTTDGQQVDVEFVSNLYEVDHQPFIQCNVRDISARRQYERAKAQAEVLADLNRRKDEFLAMLSHELRNPLAPILNAVQLLRHPGVSESPIQQQATAIIERQVGQLKTLVDELLEVSRITTGRIRLHQEDVDLRGIVDPAVESVRSLIEQRCHRLTVSLPAEPMWVHADSIRLEQVLVNLLTNAAKYTNEGGRISLTVQREGDEAVLRVRDTGVGIAPDLLPRIFELFTQAERSLDRSQGGLGVGLTVVQRLVEMHRGRVEAYSALGQGSEFVVRLPVQELPKHPSQPTPTTTTKQPASLRVLVVDDNVDQADSAAMLLRVSGHEVRVDYSGPTALAAAVEFQPDIVLLDIGLPGMDGYEVARRLRQEPSLKDIVLVAMTGYGQESDRQRSKEAGFNHHLVKPVNPQELQEILETLTHRDPLG